MNVPPGSGNPWLPLTAAQRGLYFAHALDPTNPCYTTAEVVELEGPVDPVLVARAVDLAHGEFEQLRTRFRQGAEGPEQQVVGDRASVHRLVDLSGEQDPGAAAERWMRDDLARPMDLEAGDVVRSALLQGTDRSWWFHAAHHVVLDGYGAVQLLRRVAEHVNASLSGGPAPAPSGVGLSDLVAADPSVSPEDEEFWRVRTAEMSGVVGLAGRVAQPSGTSHKVTLDVPVDDQTAWVGGARRLGVPWTDLVVAGVGAYLARFAQLPATRVGLPLMNRSLAGVGTLPSAHTVCTAMNVLPVSVPVASTLRDTLQHLATEQEELRTSPLVRQETLVRWLDRRDGSQLFGAQVNLIPFDLELRLGEVRGVVRNLTAGPVEEMTVCLRGTPGRRRTVRLEVESNPQLYSAEETRRHAARLLGWMGRFAAADDSTNVADLDLLDEAERRLVVEEFNDTSHPVSHRTLAQRFAAQATATPEATALVLGDEQVTYGAMHARVEAVARGLVAAGVRPGDVVGVMLPRSTDLFVVLHAVQRVGGVHLPLGTDLPEGRVRDMLNDGGVRTVVVESADHLRLDDAAYVVQTPSQLAESRAADLPGVPDDLDAAAYLLFTSGSTGRPKGVVVGQRAIDNRLAWMQHEFPLAEGDRVLHKTPVTFDVSVWELFWPLQVGATVVIAPPDAHRDPRALADLVVEQRVDLLHFVPSMLRAFVSDPHAVRRVGEAAVRDVVCSGEALTAALVDDCAAAFGVAPTNLYGPTEAAVDVTVCRTTAGALGPVPIGAPIWNTTTLVLDERGRPRPVDAVGELYLGGVQLADGYIGRPDLTAERFVPDPFSTEGRSRLYRTGDLARWRADGQLEYVGRTDDQVKIRGQRLELGEVESVLDAAEHVSALAAGVAADGGPASLVVWYVPTADDETAERALRALAEDHLAAGVRPSHYVAVPAIPVSVSGKADRRRLLAEHPPERTQATTAPESLLEQRLCATFAAVLGAESVAPTDDFFDLGGDSLRVLRLLGEVEAVTGDRIELRDVFAAPSPRALVGHLQDRGGNGEEFDEVLTLRTAEGSARSPLFLLPPAGGLGWCYLGLLAGLPLDQPVHVVQAPGIETGRPEPVADLAALAARQLRAVRRVVGAGAFHVAGWSLGGMAAHEVAAIARAEGQEVGAVVLLDAYPADQWRHLGEPSEQEALVGVLRLGGVPDGAVGSVPLDRASVIERLRTGGSALAQLPEAVLGGCLASVVEAARIVRTSHHRRLRGDVSVVVASAPRPETHLDATGWEAWTDGEVRQVAVPTTHGELVRQPYARRVAEVLAEAMDRAALATVP
ncbi:MAG: amino acid adenylation domain-containing protein [Nocardioides sp.]|uniref:amino acid adenylation domain-containing protein n=1 Tax=Nocardioides sp. TaxID=35761 RepID=UPI003F04E33B